MLRLLICSSIGKNITYVVYAIWKQINVQHGGEARVQNSTSTFCSLFIIAFVQLTLPRFTKSYTAWKSPPVEIHRERRLCARYKLGDLKSSVARIMSYSVSIAVRHQDTFGNCDHRHSVAYYTLPWFCVHIAQVLQLVKYRFPIFFRKVIIRKNKRKFIGSAQEVLLHVVFQLASLRYCLLFVAFYMLSTSHSAESTWFPTRESSFVSYQIKIRCTRGEPHRTVDQKCAQIREKSNRYAKIATIPFFLWSTYTSICFANNWWQHFQSNVFPSFFFSQSISIYPPSCHLNFDASLFSL